ncbi:hypothetical protein TREES_T100001461 [Tupaia chinensis]|uniref:Uncharacterized protein n=1 Tax=Tupaia chinensis TaxID=246437 RepID=L9L5W3_TUPCH|nr:hypothetical protein TREES_T100001461 [Tupaia chinensis]
MQRLLFPQGASRTLFQLPEETEKLLEIKFTQSEKAISTNEENGVPAFQMRRRPCGNLVEAPILNALSQRALALDNLVDQGWSIRDSSLLLWVLIFAPMLLFLLCLVPLDLGFSCFSSVY